MSSTRECATLFRCCACAAGCHHNRFILSGNEIRLGSLRTKSSHKCFQLFELNVVGSCLECWNRDSLGERIIRHCSCGSSVGRNFNALNSAIDNSLKWSCVGGINRIGSRARETCACTVANKPAIHKPRRRSCRCESLTPSVARECSTSSDCTTGRLWNFRSSRCSGNCIVMIPSP